MSHSTSVVNERPMLRSSATIVFALQRALAHALMNQGNGHPQPRPLRQTLLGAVVVIGIVIVGAVVLDVVKELLLWLAGHIDQFIHANAGPRLH